MATENIIMAMVKAGENRQVRKIMGTWVTNAKLFKVHVTALMTVMVAKT